MILGVPNQKGGVGKATLAVSLAATLAGSGARVLRVDADPRGGALAWLSARERERLFAVVAKATPRLHRELPLLVMALSQPMDAARLTPALGRVKRRPDDGCVAR